MELYKNTDDMLRHINAVYEAEILDYKKNSLSHKAMKLILIIFLLLTAFFAIYLMYLLYIRNGGWT